MKKQAILLAATAAAAIFSSSSMAVTFYTTGYGGFIQPASPSFPAPVNWWGGESLGGTTVYSSISWGTGQTTNGPFGTSGQSGLSINAQYLTHPAPVEAHALLTPTQNAINNSEVVPNPAELGNLTHWNNVITETFGPDNVDIRYFKNIYSDSAHNNLVASLEGTFTLSVTETPNTGIDNCCADEFTYTGAFANPTFTFDGVTYQVTTSGFFPVRGVFTGIQGTFVSQEGSNNTGYVGETILPTPEPGTLALIGAGLLSAAAIRRRSKAA